MTFFATFAIITQGEQMYFYQLITNGTGALCREGLLNVAAFVIVILCAVMLHELGHGLVAYAFGDNTAKLDGRLTLNPAKHFDLVGLLAMLLVGFGWARPVRVNVNNFKKARAGMLCVAFAGVLVNLLIAFFAALFYVLLPPVDVRHLVSATDYLLYFLAQLLSMSITVNVSFAMFNILPLFPLDGYRLLSCFIPQENGFMSFLRMYSLYILLVLLIWSNLPLIGAYSPLDLWVGGIGRYISGAFLQFWIIIII